MYATETNGTWTAPNFGFDANGHLNSISCVDAEDCTAVGSFLGSTDPDNNPNLATQAWATETDGTWGPLTALPNIPPAPPYFVSVSCSDARDCTAVGSDDANQPTSPRPTARGARSPMSLVPWVAPAPFRGSVAQAPLTARQLAMTAMVNRPMPLRQMARGVR